MIPYYRLPDLPDAGLLARYLDTLSIVAPLARTNLVTNPSFETNLTSWTAVGGAIARSASFGYYGTYGMSVNPSAGTNSDGAFYGTLSLTSGTTYAFQCQFMALDSAAIGKPYTLSIATTGGVDLVTVTFIATGAWQWVTGFYKETSTTTRRLYIRKANHAADVIFQVDGVQVEACDDGVLAVTTYIDGDQQGLVPNQFPVAYGWNGTPHGSTSFRSGQTRAGGYLMRLKDFGFLLAAIIGLGLAPPQHEALTFAQLDGGQYQNTIKPPRQFSLAGRWAAATPTTLDSGIGALCRLLDRDRIAQRQPLILLAQAMACGQPIGELVRIPALYSGGLEGNVQELPTAATPITFTQYIPYVQGRDQGWALQPRATVNNADYLVQRSAAGSWSAIAGLNGTVNAITIGPDGALYAGGAFTNAGGVAAADYIAKWDGSAWTALGTGGNSTVNAIVFDAAGNLYAGGNFTLMGGVANTAGIAKWNGSAWSALSTGLTGGVSPACYAIVIDQLGNLYAGGAFTDAGGSGADNLAKWNGSAWATVGGATAINSTVTALAIDAANVLYAGGSFTSAGGVTDADRVARWNGTVWDDMYGGTNNNVSALAIGPNGIIYAGGSFTAASGVTVGYIAQWNGISWAPVGSGMDNAVTGLDVGLSGKLYAGGIFTTANGIALPDSAAIWNGYTWLPLDIDLPGAPTVTAVTERADGTLYVGYSTSGAAGASAPSVVTNDGTTAIYPRFLITGPSSGTARLYQLVNVTSGAAIYFNYTLNVGEQAVLSLDPTNITFVSTARGNILNTILPGSNLTGFLIQPGDSTISTFVSSSTVTTTIEWKIGYNTLNDALYQTTP